MDVSGVIESIGDIERIALPNKPVHFKREVLLYVSGEFPKHVMVKFWGEKVCNHLSTHRVGDKVHVLSNVESKLIHDIWQTNITGYYIKSID